MRGLLLCMVILFTSCSEGQTRYKNISKEGLEKVLEQKSNVQLVDVRTSVEYDDGHIQGAVLIDYWSDGFLTDIKKRFDKKKPIYLYCTVGGRSSKAAQLLIDNGFKNVYSLEGGYRKWIKK